MAAARPPRADRRRDPLRRLVLAGVRPARGPGLAGGRPAAGHGGAAALRPPRGTVGGAPRRRADRRARERAPGRAGAVDRGRQPPELPRRLPALRRPAPALRLRRQARAGARRPDARLFSEGWGRSSSSASTPPRGRRRRSGRSRRYGRESRWSSSPRGPSAAPRACCPSTWAPSSPWPRPACRSCRSLSRVLVPCCAARNGSPAGARPR